MSDNIHLKIQRAEKHIKELHTITRSFFAQHPIGISGVIDPLTREPVYYVARTLHVPDQVALIVGDVLHNLRSALITWFTRSYEPTATRQALPPALQSPIMNRFLRKIRIGLMGRQRTSLTTLRTASVPSSHKGGDDGLWHLHQLDIIDKHRLPFAIAPALWRFDVERHIQATGAIDSKGEMQVGFSPGWISRHCPLKEGDVLFRDAPGMPLDRNIKFTFHMAFTEPGVEGEPVIGVLRRCSQRVFRIVQRFGPLDLG